MFNTPCYLTCTMITEAGTLLTTPSCLTCTMTTELYNLFNLNTFMYHTCIKLVSFITTTFVLIMVNNIHMINTHLLVNPQTM